MMIKKAIDTYNRTRPFSEPEMKQTKLAKILYARKIVKSPQTALGVFHRLNTGQDKISFSMLRELHNILNIDYEQLINYFFDKN